jgi:hypothetical protein
MNNCQLLPRAAIRAVTGTANCHHLFRGGSYGSNHRSRSTTDRKANDQMSAPVNAAEFLRECAPWQLPKPPSKHGKRSNYIHKRCRCEECRAVNTKYQRGLRARQAAAKEAAA